MCSSLDGGQYCEGLEHVSRDGCCSQDGVGPSKELVPELRPDDGECRIKHIPGRGTVDAKALRQEAASKLEEIKGPLGLELSERGREWEEEDKSRCEALPSLGSWEPGGGGFLGRGGDWPVSPVLAWQCWWEREVAPPTLSQMGNCVFK